MSLIICPECHSTISEFASVCVYCGFPIEKCFSGELQIKRVVNMPVAFQLPERTMRLMYMYGILETNIKTPDLTLAARKKKQESILTERQENNEEKTDSDKPHERSNDVETIKEEVHDKSAVDLIHSFERFEKASDLVPYIIQNYSHLFDEELIKKITDREKHKKLWF